MTTMTADCELDGRALDDLLYGIMEIDGHLAPTVPMAPVVALANSPGTFGASYTLKGRRVVLQANQRAVSLNARDTLIRRTLMRRLAGVMEFRVLSSPDQTLLVRCADVLVVLYTGAHANPVCDLTIILEAADPCWRTTEPVCYALTTARTACPIGASTSSPLLYVCGACVDPEVVVYDARGTEVLRLTLSVTLGANDYLRIAPTQADAVQWYVAGVLQTGTSDGLTLVSDGAWPLLSPEDATPATSGSPSIALEATSGTPTGLAIYTVRD